MTGGTAQGSPFSPSLFTIYMPKMVKRAQELDEEQQVARRGKLRNNGQAPKSSFESLQFLDDCNSVVVGRVKDMDRALGQEVEQFKPRWDRSKDWTYAVHLGVNLDKQKHEKFREEMANAAFQLVKRLPRLPPREKRKIVVWQLMAILTYGAELHD